MPAGVARIGLVRIRFVRGFVAQRIERIGGRRFGVLGHLDRRDAGVRGRGGRGRLLRLRRLQIALGERLVERRHEQARDAACDQRGGHQRDHERVAVDHLHHDDERRDRRLRDGREIADHRERDQHRQVHAAEHEVQQIAETRADRQRRREDPARNPGQVRRDHRDHFQERIQDGQLFAAVEEPARLRIAAAERRAAGCDADGGDREAAGRREHDRPLAVEREQPRRQPAAGVQQQPAEQPARDARDERGQQHGGREHLRKMLADLDRAEVGVVAVQAERDHAGDDDRGDQHAARACRKTAAQFLDREHDAGERRVERGGQAGGGAREHELAFDQRVRARVEAAQVEHQRRADLHGRPFAADREAAGDAEQRDQDLAEQDAQREQPRAERAWLRVQRRDHLRNPAALGAAKEAAREPHGQRGDGGRQQEGQPRTPLPERTERLVAPVDEPCVHHGRQAHHDRAEPEHAILAPDALRAARESREQAGALHGRRCAKR
ncbi:Uncharacterised protein [Burkholderia pseudomallei]|nr:Uncharacterised protein [Burkholderia pseudomallei]